jgi:hypothetical protein
MSKHGETEKFIEKLFKEKGEFVYGGEKLNIVKIGKPRPAKGECKTDVYILAINEKEEEKEIKISIKQSDADFLENKMSIERAKEIFGDQAKEILIDCIESEKKSFENDFLIYFKEHIKTEAKCIKIGWKFELINKLGGNRSGKISLSSEQKRDVYAGSNLSSEKKNCKVNGVLIANSGIANYILVVKDTNNDLDFYLNHLEPIDEYADDKEIYFACKAINYRAGKNKWDGNRPLSVYIDWKLEEGKIKAQFVMNRPLEVKANIIGNNIIGILKTLNIKYENFNDLKQYLDTDIIIKE